MAVSRLHSWNGHKAGWRSRLPSLRNEFATCLPTLSTKPELQDKPSKSWLLTAAATVVAVITLGVNVGALIGPVFGQWVYS